jgi:hypothetical protein
MKTFTQWLEFNQLATNINSITQKAIATKKDPKAELEKLLKNQAPLVANDPVKAAELAAAASKMNQQSGLNKPMMKKK